MKKENFQEMTSVLQRAVRYKIISTYDALAITGHSAFGIQGPPGLSLGDQVGNQ
jgi:hypothetical protein